MTRRISFFALVLVVGLFCPSCAGAPDRWSAGYKHSEQARTRSASNEVDVTLSGPIPRFNPTPEGHE